MGEYKVEQVHLRLKDDAKPKYYWPRPSHFTLKAEVEPELERLVDSDFCVLYIVASIQLLLLRFANISVLLEFVGTTEAETKI